MEPQLKKHGRKLTTAIITILFCTSLWQLAAASWIQGKAIIAQQLLSHSWQQTLKNNVDNKKQTPQKPWPWADTWPIAKLILPEHNIEQIVLAGDSGSSLAFAPGYSLASAKPNTFGTTVISAHRDTHFKFLKNIKLNDSIILQTTTKTTHYRVVDMQIVDSKNYTIQDSDYGQTLVLASCYPFNTVTTGGSLRYLVFAMSESDSQLKIVS